MCFAVGRGASEIGRYVGASGFSGGDNSQALDALTPPAYTVGQLLMLLGSFALGFAFVMLAMNAMRVGLLTRFMGVLGVIVGATFVLPLDQQGIIRSFWLAALGFLIAGRWPSGMPPAWETGAREPWPSAARAGARAAPAAAAGDAGAGAPCERRALAGPAPQEAQEALNRSRRRPGAPLVSARRR